MRCIIGRFSIDWCIGISSKGEELTFLLVSVSRCSHWEEELSMENPPE